MYVPPYPVRGVRRVEEVSPLHDPTKGGDCCRGDGLLLTARRLLVGGKLAPDGRLLLELSARDNRQGALGWIMIVTCHDRYSLHSSLAHFIQHESRLTSRLINKIMLSQKP